MFSFKNYMDARQFFQSKMKFLNVLRLKQVKSFLKSRSWDQEQPDIDDLILDIDVYLDKKRADLDKEHTLDPFASMIFGKDEERDFLFLKIEPNHQVDFFKQLEKAAIKAALVLNKGCIVETSRFLGVSDSTLKIYINKHKSDGEFYEFVQRICKESKKANRANKATSKWHC